MTSLLTPPAQDLTNWQIIYQPGEGRQTIVCLYRDQTSGGPSRTRKWQASIDPSDRSKCQEYLTADLDRRRLYLAFANLRALGGTMAGKADEYCPEARPPQTYDACTSTFFLRPFPESPAYRKLDTVALRRAVDESGVVFELERLIRDKEATVAAARLAAYRADAAAATSVDAIRSFEKLYRANDPDRYITTLRDRLPGLERDEFASATSSSALVSFIARFRHDDPAQLVPIAEQKLAALERVEFASASSSSALASFVARFRSNDPAQLVAAAEEKLPAIRAREQVSRERADLEGRIAFCKATIRNAQSAIAREREIGAVSGVVSQTVLHDAWRRIVQCREVIPGLYAQYWSQGGRRSLESIQ